MGCRAGILRAALALVVLGVTGTLAGGVLGCAVASTANNCSLKAGVLPALASADHSAAAPGNQASFNVGFVPPFPTGCAVPAIVQNPANFTWVSSDPVNAPISNVAATAGVATCVGPTTVPATISVSSTTNVEVATLTCK